MSVVLVDAGGTNIGSVRYALARLGADAALTADADTIRRADKVILPGVGAAGPGMARLRELGLVDLMRSLTQPVLGVCLGMQLLFEHSEEGATECLGVIPGTARRFADTPELRVPHMGWNRLHIERQHPLVAGLDGAHGAHGGHDRWAYFVHSYALPPGEHTLATADFGGAFSAVVARENFHGMQFHPERSAAVGARLLKNFLEL
ncbi:imidazole glycerol phosphate synthase subunit HisH [Dyella sp. 2RAB6]|uniref:imidazole glycerol phosphate synthase subunit HisH n=1 Tax=Dyella sp. 2RAB6 TaxID=3232992 RepID=UPI003F902218